MPSPFQLNLDDLTLARLRRGEAAAQTSVFRQFERPVHTLCVRLLGDVNQALDALQDCFVQAFVQIASFRGDSVFGLWLRSIVVHRCLREIRDRKALLGVDELDDSGDLVQEESSLLERIDLHNAVPVAQGPYCGFTTLKAFAIAKLRRFLAPARAFLKPNWRARSPSCACTLI